MLEQCFKNLRETKSGAHTPCFRDWRWNHSWFSSFQLYCWSPNSSTLPSISSPVIISQLPLHQCHVFVLHPWLSFWAMSIWWRWWQWWKGNYSEKKQPRTFAPRGFCWIFSFRDEAVKSCQEVIHPESYWTLQVFISCYEEWSCWSKFQASKKSSLDFCLKKRSAALTDTKLASKKRTFPPRFLSFLDLCLVFDYPDDLHLSLFSSWQTYSLCVFETVLGVGSLQAFPPHLP